MSARIITDRAARPTCLLPAVNRQRLRPPPRPAPQMARASRERRRLPCLARIGVSAIALAPMTPLSRSEPRDPRIGSRSPGSAGIRCVDAKGGAGTVSSAPGADRGGGLVHWRSRGALVILRSNDRSVATSSGVRKSVARPGARTRGARPVAGRRARRARAASWWCTESQA